MALWTISHRCVYTSYITLSTIHARLSFSDDISDMAPSILKTQFFKTSHMISLISRHWSFTGVTNSLLLQDDNVGSLSK